MAQKKVGRLHEVDYDCALEVASHEAIIRQTYVDSVGVDTWSVGLTSATGHDVKRYIGKPQTLQHCLNIYVWALKNYAKQVQDVFADTALTKEQFVAAVSFHWNTGGLKRASWVKHFKAGDMKKARSAFLSWNKPKEIIGRRKLEAALFFDGLWSNKGTMTEYTRLTKNRTPVWSSAVKVNVVKELQAAFKVHEEPILDSAPQPNAKPATPTLSPGPSVPAPEPTPAPVAPRPPAAPTAPEAISNALVVQAAQQMLKDKGYTEVGVVDGKIGKQTKTAILAFRNENDLPIRDTIDQQFLDALEAFDHRSLEREKVKAEVIRSNVPEVRSNWLNKIIGGLGLGGLGLGAINEALLPNILTWRELFSDIPSWVWLAIGAVAFGLIVYNSQWGQKAGEEAFKTGERR